MSNKNSAKNTIRYERSERCENNGIRSFHECKSRRPFNKIKQKYIHKEMKRALVMVFHIECHKWGIHH